MGEFADSAAPFIAFLKARRLEPRVILDVGSRDGLQAIEFHEAFPQAAVFAFEALPESVRRCEVVCGTYRRIEVVEGAVHSIHGAEVAFHQVVAAGGWPGHPGVNAGASSLFRAINQDYAERYEQAEIPVRSLRLDRWAAARRVTSFDVVWMDLQGGELLALEGMGTLIHTVRAIKVEMTTRPMYHGQAMYGEVDRFLTEHGLRQVVYTERFPGWWGDAVYWRGQGAKVL